MSLNVLLRTRYVTSCAHAQCVNGRATENCDLDLDLDLGHDLSGNSLGYHCVQVSLKSDQCFREKSNSCKDVKVLTAQQLLL